MTLIEEKHIQICKDHMSWEQAIAYASKPLLSDGHIEQKYIDDMINNVKTLGPYIVIAPRFALAHAQTSPAIKATGLSLAIFEQDILFNCANDPVNVIIVLASKNTDEHLEKLGKIAEMLSDKELEIVDNLSKAGSIREAYSLINQQDLLGYL